MSGARASLPLSARLRAVLDEVPALIAVMRGPELVVEFANFRHRDLTGSGDLTGRSLVELLEQSPGAVDPGLRRQLDELRRAVEQGESAHGWAASLRFPGLPGETFWDYVVIPLRDAPDATPLGVVLHATEVTRLVEAQRRAAGAEHRFTTLFESNVVGVSISDESQVLEANDAFLAMVDRTREELAAGLSWTAITAPDTLPGDERALEFLRTTG